MKRTFHFLLVAFCLSAGVSVSAQTAVLPDTASLVPPETVLLVDIYNFSQLKEQFEKTSFYKLYKDAAMAAFVSDAKSKWREEIRKLDNKLAEAVLSAGVLPQGRTAIALVVDEQAGNTKGPPVLFIAQWGENAAKIKEAIDETVKKAVESGWHKRSEDYRGVSIETLIYSGDSSRISYCFIDDCLMGSVNPELLQFVIAHIKGSASPTLASEGDYGVTKGAIGPYHDIDFYINIEQIIKASVAEDTTGQARTTITNLGFDNVAFFGWSAGVSRLAGSSLSSKAFLKIDGGKKGVCKMLEVESSVLRPPRFIPASACSATFFNLDIKKAHEELVNILRRFSAEAAAVMFMPLIPASPDGEPALELKRDIIDYLGSQMVIAQSINKPPSADTPTDTIFALATNNRKALEKSLSLLHSKSIALNNPDARRELLGYTIYLISMPGLPFFPGGVTPMQGPADAATVQMPTFAFTVTDTHLIFGLESSVERTIRALSSTGAKSVASAEWFTLSQSAIPSAVGLASLQDNAAAAELSWRTIKKIGENKTADSSTSVGAGVSSQSVFPHLIFSHAGLDLLNAALLPEFDVVRKYFGVSACYGVSRPDGFFFEFKYLDTPQSD
jgi:hypothetical protein